MNSKKYTLETLLDRLDAGESLADIQTDLGSQANADLEIIEFLQAQRTSAVPDPNNLKQALLQASLIEAQETNDEWGSFMSLFSEWKTWVGVAVSVLGVAVLVNPTGQQTTSLVQQPAESVMQESALAYKSRAATGTATVDPLVESWEAELASEMEDLYETKETLESLYSDPVFSALPPKQS